MVSSQYLQIALDLVSIIAKEEFSEGSKIYGRSVMASEYNVSPETIRSWSHGEVTKAETIKVRWNRTDFIIDCSNDNHS